MTNLPYELLQELSIKLLEVPDVHRVYFDVTTKPPSTIEYV
ncbi:MAG: GMP synthase (glutamine-hydrolyzing) [Candidatus Heimdallarchaeota archaeon]